MGMRALETARAGSGGVWERGNIQPNEKERRQGAMKWEILQDLTMGEGNQGLSQSTTLYLRVGH